MIFVGKSESSILGKNCDIFLKVKINREPDQFNMLATSSSMCVLALFDSICISIIQYKGFSKKDFSINHPGGAVGKRLNNNN